MPRPDRNKLQQSFGTTPPPLTIQELADTVYGEIAAADGARLAAEPVDIFLIHADLTQPRRTVVSEFRSQWNGKAEHISALFDAWFKAVMRERYDALKSEPNEEKRRRAAVFDLRAHLEGDGDKTDQDRQPGPIDASFLQIVNLAASIRRDGLTNPITVAPSSAQYRLETGERRWLAFHLLHLFFDGTRGRSDEREHWRRIPARVVEQASVWRMANENNVRADLNAIGKARQFALLMIDIYARRGHHFASYYDLVQPGFNDRAFYAQVADGDEFSMRGGTDMLLNAMGFGSTSQLRDHRDLLRLPDEVWQWADDLNWTQWRIRGMVQKAGGSEELLIELARHEAIKDGLSVVTTSLSDFPSHPSPPPLPDDGPHKRGKMLLSRENKARLKWLMSIRGGVGQADNPTQERVLAEIANARRWLEQLEQAVKKGK